MKRKLLSAILCGTMALTMLAGCGSSQEQRSEKSKNAANDQSSSSDISGELNIVHFLSEPQKVEALDEMVAGFEKEYPNVKVNQESTTLENYQDVLKLKFSTGDVPDVVFGAPKTYSTFVESGNIEDITDERLAARLKELSQEDLELLTQFIIQGFTQSDLEQMGYGKQYKISRRISRLKNFLKK